MRLQSRLVDSEGWVRQNNPEECNDTVDAGEADEGAEGKYAV